jgi:hypothetical protein
MPAKGHRGFKTNANAEEKNDDLGIAFLEATTMS